MLERRDTVQGRHLRNWWDQGVLPRLADHILPVDAATALRCAPLHVPDSRPEIDPIIAATALVHNLTLATRDVRDFAGTGVRLVDPFAYRVGTGSAPE